MAYTEVLYTTVTRSMMGQRVVAVAVTPAVVKSDQTFSRGVSLLSHTFGIRRGCSLRETGRAKNPRAL